MIKIRTGRTVRGKAIGFILRSGWRTCSGQDGSRKAEAWRRTHKDTQAHKQLATGTHRGGKGGETKRGKHHERQTEGMKKNQTVK